MWPTIVRFVIIYLCTKIASGSKDDDFQVSLATAKLKLNSIIDDMKGKWEMHRMPNFLRSVAMTHSSWEILKVCHSFPHLFTLTYFLNESFNLYS